MVGPDELRQKLKEEYWLNRLKGARSAPFFLADQTVGGGPDGVRTESTTHVPRDLLHSLSRVSAGSRRGKFILCLAALEITLFRYGVPVNVPLLLPSPPADGEAAEAAHVFYRLAAAAEESGADVIGRVQAELLEALPRRGPDLDALATKYSALGLGDVESLFQLWFSYEVGSARRGESERCAVAFKLIEGEGEARLLLSHREGARAAEMLPGFARHFLNVLRQLLKHPRFKVRQFDLLSPEEERRLLVELNDSAAPARAGETLMQLVEERAARTPVEVAVVCGGRTFTYREVNERANAVARHLRERFGVGPEDKVALILGRSEWMVMGMLGVLKSGAAVIPIDISTPEHRVRLMLEDSGCRVVLTDDAYASSGVRTAGVDFVRASEAGARPEGQNPPHVNAPAGLAFVIYTSGSTGRPKGVMIQHDQLANKLYTALDRLQFSAAIRCLVVAFFSSDAALYQIFCTLLAGGRLYLVDVDRQNHPLEFWKIVSAEGINFINCVPSFMAAMLDGLDEGGARPEFEHLILGGDVVPVGLYRRIRERLSVRHLVNLYGPTEVTVEATCYEFDGPVPAHTIPIGRPSPNYRVYVLDEYQKPVPAGVAGELYVGGVGVARGYLGRPGLTAEKFLPDPFTPGGRLYRTGDAARWLSCGQLEFLGRGDGQVKVRGHRVELREVESLLAGLRGVKEAVVEARETAEGDKELVAYVVAEDWPGEATAREHLRRLLPESMLPSGFVLLDGLPLTPNGKVDRGALPVSPRRERAQGGDATLGSEVEARLAGIFGEVLNRPRVGVDENFFALGGHSLKAARVVARVYKEFDVELGIRQVFDRPTVRELAALIDHKAGTHGPRIGPIPEREYYDLSHAQKRMWMLMQMGPGPTSAYNMPEAYLLEGRLDSRALRRAFDELVSRHESLRTTFVVIDGMPRQRIHREPRYSLEFAEAAPHGDEGSFIREAFERESSTIFDLEAGPLLRVRAYGLGGERHLLIINMHHIVGDGWSMGVLLREVLDSYEAYARGEAPVRRAPQVQYKEYAAWHNSWLESPQARRDSEFWRGVLSGELPVLDLPADRPRPPVRSLRGSREHFAVGRGLTEGLRGLSRGHEVSTFMTLVSLVNCLLYRYSGSADIVVGSPVAGRTLAELENQIGFFVNLVTLRHGLSPEQSFAGLLSGVKSVVLEAFEHEGYPFDKVLDELAPERNLSRNLVFDVVVLMQVTDALDVLSEFDASPDRAVHVKPLDLKMDVCPFDLIFSFLEGDELELTIDYNADIYDAGTVRRLGTHFVNLLRSAVGDPRSCIADLAMLDEGEELALLARGAAPMRPYPLGKTLADLFDECAASYTDHTALVCEGYATTYRELNERANGLARRLQDEWGVGADDVVAVAAGRPELTVLSALAVLKAGGAYLPLIIDESADRLEFILLNSGCKLLLTESRHAARFSALLPTAAVDVEAVERVSASPARGSGAGTLAYVINTSGSTGEPKGVMIENRGIVNNLLWRAEYYGYDDSCRVLQVPSFSFDTSVADIFATLTTGGTLYLVPHERRMDLEYLSSLAERHRVNLFMMTTSVYQAFLEQLEVPLPSLRTVVVGGEVLLPRLVEQHYARLPQAGLFSEYGATECGVCSTVLRCGRGLEPASVGEPIANSRLDVLDRTGKLTPAGAVGEICLGGVGLGRGYLKDAALTRRKFVPHPYLAGEMMYRTGDLGRRHAGGRVEFLGREDTQIKLRGYRIEPAEIEGALARHPDVTQSAVLLCDGARGEKELTAYVMTEAQLTAGELRTFLEPLLPHYMIPARFVALQKFPRLPSGKVDRKLLPPAGADVHTTAGSYTGPRNQLDARLVAIWEALLEREGVGIDDNFFELGGHSLKVTRLAAEISSAFGVKLPLAEFFERQTVRELSDLVSLGGAGRHAAMEPLEELPSYELSHAQKRLWVMDREGTGRAAFAASSAFILREEVDEALFWRALDLVVARHESLRTTFANASGEPRQVIHPGPLYEREAADLCGAGDAAPRVAEYLRAAAAAVFDLERGPLVRVKLLRVAEAEYVLILTIHHIACDGWGLRLILSELAQAYRRLRAGRDAALLPPRLQYKDYAAWHNALLSGAEGQRLKSYWRERFASPPPPLDLPLDFARPDARSYEAASVSLTLDEATTLGLKELGRRHGASLFMTLCATFAALLHHLTGQDDLVVGFPAACRHHPGLSRLVGCFVNPIPLRIKLDSGESFASLLRSVRRACVEAYEHQDYPFDMLVGDLRLPRDPGRSPLFDVGFTWDDFEGGPDVAGLTFDEYPQEDATVKDDLRLFGGERGGRVWLTIGYSLSLFRRETVSRIAEALRLVIAAALCDDEVVLSDIEIRDEVTPTADEAVTSRYQL